MKIKKIIITGGCGFIGSSLTDFLINKGYEIYIIDNFSNNKITKPNKKSKFYKIDIRNIDEINKIKNVYAIIHLAAIADILISKDNEKKYFNNNLKGFQDVLNFCSNNKIKKLIFASSASVYGNKDKTAVKEHQSLDPGHYYAYSKLIGENMLKLYSKINKFDYTILRFFNIYGPKSNAVISTFLAQKLQKKKITIFGNGKQKRDFLYIDDLCDAILKVLENKKAKNETYNLGSGKSISINELKNKLSHKDYINLEKRNDDIEVSIANISKIKKHLNWFPKISIEEGLKRSMENDFYRLKKMKILSISNLKKIIKKFNN